MKPEVPVEFFKAVAGAINIGVTVHLYPMATKAFYPVETLLQLCEIPNLKAIQAGASRYADVRKGCTHSARKRRLTFFFLPAMTKICCPL